MERLIVFGMFALVAAVIWLTVDALIMFNSLDLPKIIGGF